MKILGEFDGLSSTGFNSSSVSVLRCRFLELPLSSDVIRELSLLGVLLELLLEVLKGSGDLFVDMSLDSNLLYSCEL